MDKSSYSAQLNALMNQYFSVERGDTTPERMLEMFRLREQVYVKEQGFEEPDEHGFEYKDSDYHSGHTVLIHKDSGIMFGTTRTVMASRMFSGPAHSFPFQEALDTPEEFAIPGYVDHSCEFGRFAISKERRKEILDGQPGPTYSVWQKIKHEVPFWEGKETGKVVQDLLELAPLLLVRGGIERGLEEGEHPPAFAGPGEPQVDYLLAPPKAKVLAYNFVDVALEKLLASRFGVHGETLTDPVEYHGRPRVLQKIYMPQMLEIAKEQNPALWALMTDNGQIAERMTKALETVPPELQEKFHTNISRAQTKTPPPPP